MEMKYIDRHGVKHDIEISTTFHNQDKVYLIHRDGALFLELIHDDGRWAELYSGYTENSEEYGKLLDQTFVLAD